jgi:hypothetical protein
MCLLNKVSAFSPLFFDSASQSDLETAVFVKCLVFRQKIDMDDGDSMRFDMNDSLRHQRKTDATSLPYRMYYHIYKHGVPHTVAENGAPCNEYTCIVKTADRVPVTVQCCGIVLLRATPADSFA